LVRRKEEEELTEGKIRAASRTWTGDGEISGKEYARGAKYRLRGKRRESEGGGEEGTV